MSEPRPSVLAWLALAFVRFYQRFLSKPLHLIPGSGCRFHPTCSCYTATALSRFGFFKGGWMGFRRSAVATLGVVRVSMKCRSVEGLVGAL